MQAGTLVTLQGLIAKPELNGAKARVLSAEHSKEAAEGYSRGRVPVKLVDCGSTLSLKPEALAPATACASASGLGYDALCERAVGLFQERKLAQAVATLKEAIAIEPGSFTAHWQLGQVHEVHEEPGSSELAAMSYLKAAELAAPDSTAPDFEGWSNAFIRAANLLKTLPAAAKPPWWNPLGLKQRCGLVLANPQGYLPDSELVSPAWQLTGFAFEMENQHIEAAKAYESAAGYEMDGARCQTLMARAAELRSGGPAEAAATKTQTSEGSGTLV